VISASSSSVLTSIHVGGTFSQLYGVVCDSVRTEIFVADLSENNVSVLSVGTLRLLASVEVGGQPQGITFDGRTGEVFVANGGSSNLSVVSAASLAEVATKPVLADPNGIAYDNARRAVFVGSFVFTGGSDAVEVVHDSTLSAVGAVTVGVRVEGVAYDSGTAEVYASNEISDNVSVISGTYDVVFTESGLGSGTIWSVNLAGTSNSSSTPVVGFREIDGTYQFTVGSVGSLAPNPAHGQLRVAATPALLAIHFSPSGGSSGGGFSWSWIWNWLPAFLPPPWNFIVVVIGGVVTVVAAVQLSRRGAPPS
jgi:YVTN family beta-propeller protein